MKAIIRFTALLFFFNSMLFPQDTAIVKYLPLKIGNVWVYNWVSLFGTTQVDQGQVRIAVTSTVQSNGHNYYNLEQTGTPCACAQPTNSPFLYQLNNPIRIDSSTGNVFWKSSTNCGWHFGESLFDSLKMEADTTVSTNCFLVSHYDSDPIVLFGSNYPSTYVGMNIMTYGTFRRYVKGFGLATSHQNGSNSTSCTYSLAGCVLNGVVYGDTTITGIYPIFSEIPKVYALSQNYPNPFNPVTIINYQLPVSNHVKLAIYDVMGREIAVLVNEHLNPGTYEAEWDGTNYPSGVYFYKLITAEYTETRKMVLVK